MWFHLTVTVLAVSSLSSTARADLAADSSTSHQLSRRSLPLVTLCHDDEDWVGRFCHAQQSSAFVEVCWRVSAPQTRLRRFRQNQLGLDDWLESWSKAVKHDLRADDLVDPLVFLRGDLNKDRIPRRRGVAAWRVRRCPMGYVCGQRHNEGLRGRDAHIWCIPDPVYRRAVATVTGATGSGARWAGAVDAVEPVAFYTAAATGGRPRTPNREAALVRGLPTRRGGGGNRVFVRYEENGVMTEFGLVDTDAGGGRIVVHRHVHTPTDAVAVVVDDGEVGGQVQAILTDNEVPQVNVNFEHGGGDDRAESSHRGVPPTVEGLTSSTTAKQPHH